MKKVTFILKLNVLPIVLCLLLFPLNQVFAQNKKVEIYGNKTEKKGEKSIFIIHEQGAYNIVYNKSNSLMIYESSKEAKSEHTPLNWDDYIRFSEKEKIDSLFYKKIAPFYKGYKSKYGDKIGSFDIVLYAKPDGTIIELSFSCQRDANIPLKAIEKLEKDILSLGLRLEFDKEHYYFNDAIWIDYSLKYSVYSMKEKLKAERDWAK